ncbi:MAG TPA: DUF6531 domain-containing protein, partial [Symbiobacteriaceae bacterium]|nr:DUF6531 domain-containing protein [Symbiobacteriaceae bacterium]
MPQRWFHHLRRPIARITVAAMLASTLPLGSLFQPAVASAASDPVERKAFLTWLPDVVPLGEFPAGYPEKGPDETPPAMISLAQSTAELAFPFPQNWVPPTYGTADVTFSAQPFEEPLGPATIHTDSYDVAQPARLTWDGGGRKDGLYTWSYRAVPVKPECPPPPPDQTGTPPAEPAECWPEFDASDATGDPYPVVIDRAAPEVLGLQLLRDDWLGVEVKDQTSGVAAVEAEVFAANGGSASSLPRVELNAHPRHAIVRLNVTGPGAEDWMVRLTVTDWAGNRSTETIPLYPLGRTPQLGTGGPWPSASAVIGGQTNRINLVSGNGFLTQWEFGLSAHSLTMPVSRSYNHQVREKGLLGWGWRLSLEANLKQIGSVRIWRDSTGTDYWWDQGSGEMRPYVDGIRREWPKLGVQPGSAMLYFQDGSTISFDGNGKVVSFNDYRYQP